MAYRGGARCHMLPWASCAQAELQQRGAPSSPPSTEPFAPSRPAVLQSLQKPAAEGPTAQQLSSAICQEFGLGNCQQALVV